MHAPVNSDPLENKILAALSPFEYELIFPHLHLVEMLKGEIILESTNNLQYVYFPIDTIASLLCPMEDGSTVEIAAVGKEGMLGISAFLGGGGLTEAIVLTSGKSFRISKKIFQDMLMRSGGRRASNLQKALLKYTSSLFIQMTQTAACTRRHALEQQFSRWLLLNFDRQSSSSLFMTHESISVILGVRRESITEIAKRLKEAGAIDYHRGQIDLANRTILETTSCECYQIMKDKIFPHMHVNSQQRVNKQQLAV